MILHLITVNNFNLLRNCYANTIYELILADDPKPET